MTRPDSGGPTRTADYDAIIDDLTYRYSGTFSRESVAAAVLETRSLLEPTNKLPEFLPLMTERFARERLLASAQSQGLIAKATPEILFVCVQNAGRSQMAAALADRLSEGRVHVRSAGSQPTGEIQPLAVEVLHERGIDLSTAFPKPLTDDVVHAADVIVTMGCGDACPVLPGKRYLDWDVDDPHGQSIEGVRAIRDDIERRVKTLLAEILEGKHP